MQVLKSCTRRGRLASLAPWHIASCKRGHTTCQTFLTFLGPYSDCQGYSGHFRGLFWGSFQVAKVNLPTFLWGFASSISWRLTPKYLSGSSQERRFAQTTWTILKLPIALAASDRCYQSILDLDILLVTSLSSYSYLTSKSGYSNITS